MISLFNYHIILNRYTTAIKTYQCNKKTTLFYFQPLLPDIYFYLLHAGNYRYA